MWASSQPSHAIRVAAVAQLKLLCLRRRLASPHRNLARVGCGVGEAIPVFLEWVQLVRSYCCWIHSSETSTWLVAGRLVLAPASVALPLRPIPTTPCQAPRCSHWIALHTKMPLQIVTPTPSDIDIAQSVKCRPITEIAAKLGLTDEDCEPHGHDKAKVGAGVQGRVAKTHPASCSGPVGLSYKRSIVSR